MRILSITLIFLFACFYLNAQDWRQMKNEAHKYTFKQMQDAFYKEHKNLELEKDTSGEEEEFEGEEYQFKRWEWFMRDRLNSEGKVFNWMSKNREELGRIKSRRITNQAIAGKAWQSMGPSNYTVNGGHNGGVGRVNCIAFHPTDPNIFWIGTPAGGLWKTKDKGSTWVPLTEDLPNIGVSGIAVNPSNPNEIYILTGDGDGLHTYSIGILKSTNGGSTWGATGLKWNVSDRRWGFKLIMDPTDPAILYVATDDGIIKTTNGFNTSAKQLAGTSITDIEFKPGNSKQIYAVSANKFYRTSTAGKNWAVISGTPGSGLPLLASNRAAIAVTPSDPDLVYVAFSGSTGFLGLYLSRKSGEKFTLKSNSPNVMGYEKDGSDSKSQSWYDFTLAASLVDNSKMFIGGINLWRSTDQGTNWTIISHWFEPGNTIGYTHADQHSLGFNPLNNLLYAGTDGGIYVSADNGDTWVNLSAGLVITQNYRVSSIDSRNKATYFGTQDNGTNAIASTPNMIHLRGGDGGESIVKDGAVYATTAAGENIYRNLSDPVTSSGTWTDVLVGSPLAGLKGDFVLPFTAAPTLNNIYAAYNTVFTSADKGSNWTEIPQFRSGSNYRCIAVSNGDATTEIYASTGDKVKIKSSTGFFGDITSGLPISPGTVEVKSICISTDPAVNGAKAWVTFNGYDAATKVYETSNGGSNWSNYSTGLPNVPINCIVHTPNNPNDLLYAGTDIGVYYKDKTMTEWLPYNEGMPNVIIMDLEINKDEQTITAGTFGRGLWKAPLIDAGSCEGFAALAAQQKVELSIECKNNILCPGESTTLTALPCGLSYKWSTGETTQSITVTQKGLYSVTATTHDTTLTAYQNVCRVGDTTCLEWLKTLDGGGDLARDVLQTIDGGYIIVGGAGQTSRDVSGYHGGTHDVWVVKINSTGNIEWQKCLGGSGPETGWKIQPTLNGGYILVATTVSTDGNVSGFHGTPNSNLTNPDIWVVKLNSTGNIEWQKCLGGTSGDFGYSLLSTTDGGYILAGQTFSHDGDVTGNHSEPGRFGDAWVVKIDSTGNIKWQKCLGGTRTEAVFSIISTPDGGYIVTGNTDSNDGDVSGIHPPDDSTRFDYRIDAWVVKLSSNGSIEWQKCLGGGKSDQLMSILSTGDGYILVGGTRSNNGDVSGKHSPTSPTNDLWVVKTSLTGNIEWQKCLGGTGHEAHDVGDAIILTTDGGYMIAGYTGSNDGDVSGNHGPPGTSGDYDAWIVKLDNAHNIEWQRCYGGAKRDVAQSILQTSNGSYIVAGSTTSNDGDITSNQGPGWLLIKFSEACAKPLDGFNTINITSSSADALWTTKSCATGYNVQYKRVGDSSWNVGVVSSNTGTYNISGLIPDRTYEWRVQSNCDKVSSVFSPTQTFRTLPLTAITTTSENTSQLKNDLNSKANSIKIWPNPANTVLNIELNGDFRNGTTIQLQSIQGKLLKQEKIQSFKTHQVDISNLASGVYFITVTDNKGARSIEKVVIQH